MSSAIGRVGLSAITVVTLIAIASPSARADASGCPSVALTQPFSRWGDSNRYVLVPGQRPGNFDGNGWVLGGGATLVTTTVPGGARATVLDLPRGAWAVSPSMCVDPSYTSARMMIRGAGGPSSVSARVWYGSSRRPHCQQDMGRAAGASRWEPSGALSLTPQSGRQTARFRLSARNGESEIYNFYVDPYGRG